VLQLSLLRMRAPAAGPQQYTAAVLLAVNAQVSSICLQEAQDPVIRWHNICRHVLRASLFMTSACAVLQGSAVHGCCT
jgi:hypothetical protein